VGNPHRRATGESPAVIGAHTLTCHPTQVNTPHHRFTYPGWMEGWVYVRGWLHTEIVYPPTYGHPSKY